MHDTHKRSMAADAAVLTLSIGASVMLACSRPCGIPETNSRSNANETPTTSVLTGKLIEPRVVADASVAFQATHVGATTKQGAMFGEVIDSEDPTLFHLRNQTLDQATGVWNSAFYEFSASFAIREMTTKQQNQFFLRGEINDGSGGVDSVVERWTVVPGHTVEGAPQPNLSIRRTELFRGSSLGDIRSIEIDPQERFLLILHDQAGVTNLSKFPLPYAGAVTTLYTSVEIPHLADVVRMSRHLHDTEGMMWILEDGLLENITTLYDQNDDGVFEAESTLSYENWTLQYGGDVWTDDFVFDA